MEKGHHHLASDRHLVLKALLPNASAVTRSCRNPCVFVLGQVAKVDHRDHTRAMRGRPGPGALIGLTVGVALVAMVLWLPRALDGDFYEFSDPLIFMGLPMIIISTAVGALIGVPVNAPPGDGPPGQVRRASGASRAVVGAVAVTAILVALWFFLTATGSI